MSRAPFLPILACPFLALLAAYGGCGGSTPINATGEGGNTNVNEPDGGSAGSGGKATGGGGQSGQAGKAGQGSGGSTGTGTGGVSGGTGGTKGGTGGTTGGTGGIGTTGAGGVNGGAGGAISAGGTTGTTGAGGVNGGAGGATSAGGAGGAMPPACMAGAKCDATFNCDQPCRMGGRMGNIACFCDPNGTVACENCVVGPTPTCPATVVNNQACTVGTDMACDTPCANGVNARCNCVAAAGGAMRGMWRCTQNAGVCM
jgi:hypothetical protein